jgi:hypothetical protein
MESKQIGCEDYRWQGRWRFHGTHDSSFEMVAVERYIAVECHIVDKSRHG